MWNRVNGEPSQIGTREVGRQSVFELEIPDKIKISIRKHSDPAIGPDLNPRILSKTCKNGRNSSGLVGLDSTVIPNQTGRTLNSQFNQTSLNTPCQRTVIC